VLEREMTVWVSVGEGNFSQLRGGGENIFVFPQRSLFCTLN